MATVTVEYYGMDGTGRTVTEARKDAGKKITAALSGSYTPELLVWRGEAVLVVRDPMGWDFRSITDGKGVLRDGPVWTRGGNYKDKDSAMRSARNHLAQMGWQPADGTNPPPFLTDREAVAEFRHWAEFQMRYTEARAKGFTDRDAFDYAGRNPCRPEVWQTPPTASVN